jgi:hypothetical protein
MYVCGTLKPVEVIKKGEGMNQTGPIEQSLILILTPHIFDGFSIKKVSSSRLN